MITGDEEENSSAKPASVLFVCNHNIIRSQMAEAMTKQLYGRSIYVQSAGVREGTPDPFVGTVMAELGIDLHNRIPRALDDLEEEYFDLIVTLSPTAHHRALELTGSQEVVVEYWPAADPTAVQGSREQVLNAYRDVRDRLRDRILVRLGKPENQPESNR